MFDNFNGNINFDASEIKDDKGALFVTNMKLYTYPINIDLLKRRRFSLTSPLVKYN